MKLKISDKIAAGGILAVLGLLGFIVVKGLQSDINLHHRTIDAFHDINQLDTGLNELVLRSRVSLVENYDSIVKMTEKASSVCENLKLLLDEPKPALQQAIRDYCGALNEKLESVEKFKSKNSILKNSLKYLPVLAEQFRKTNLDRDVHNILVDVLLYDLNPNSDMSEGILKEMKAIKLKESTASTKKLTQNLDKHVGVILTTLRDLTLIDQEFILDRVGGRIEKLENAYFESYNYQQKIASRYRYGLLSICGFLVIVLIWIFNRMYQMGQKLSNWNKNLEKKVHKRTLELSLAMEELAKNQQMLSQAAKMSALGEMAGGIAHEINTPLGAITIYAGTLMEQIRNEQLNIEECEKNLEAIIKIVQRISRIIYGLRRFSRAHAEEEKIVTSIQTIIQDTLVFCSEKFKNNSVNLQVSAMDQEYLLDCMPEQISQVVLNLLNNSFDAIGPLEIEDKWIRIDLLEEGGFLKIVITDCGLGIPKDVRDKIMQPFFTTKGVGKGTGLGLSISKGIIESHHGQFYYEDKSKNTQFVVMLPLLQRKVA